MSLLVEARSLSRKTKKSDFDTQTKNCVARIQKLILKHAAMGDSGILIRKVPYRREYIANDKDSFIAIAKTFAKLGFAVSYDVKDTKSYSREFKLTPKKKALPPCYSFSTLNISWSDE